jgi:hypothetical protein
MADIRLSTTQKLSSTAGVYLIGWKTGGIPVSIDPAILQPTAASIGAITASDLSTALTVKQDRSERGAANGYATLDSGGRVPTGQLPASGGGGAVVSNATPFNLGVTASPGISVDASRVDHIHKYPLPVEIGAADVNHTHAIAAVTGLQLALNNKLDATQKASVNGVAPLGADGKVPGAYLPAGISQASLDVKADISYVNSSLSTKADITYVDTGLATKASATDTRIVNAVQPGYLTVVESIAANYTAVQADANKIKRSTSTSDITITLPALSIGTTIRFIASAAGNATFVAGASQTLNSFGGFVKSGGLSANIIATCTATNTWNISGNLV